MLDARDDRTRAEASNSAATGASVVAWRMSKERPHPRAKEMQDVFEEFESARHWVYRTGTLRRIEAELFSLLSPAGYAGRKIIAQVERRCIAGRLYLKDARDALPFFEPRVLIEASQNEVRHVSSIATECETPLEHLADILGYQVFRFVSCDDE
jgi:hypothetical protein